HGGTPVSPPVEVAIDQLAAARRYTEWLLEHVPETDWFRMPPGVVTHVGWQVGHVAVAEYRLALFRIRGPAPGDADLIPQSFQALFGATTAPGPDPTRYPSPPEIREVLGRVHGRALEEARTFA